MNEENFDYLENEDDDNEPPKTSRKKLFIIIAAIIAAIVVIATVVTVSVVLTNKDNNDKLNPEAPNPPNGPNSDPENPTTPGEESSQAAVPDSPNEESTQLEEPETPDSPSSAADTPSTPEDQPEEPEKPVVVPPINSEYYLNLKIDPNHDSLKQSNYKFYNGQVITEEDLSGFTRNGYELEGWYTSKECTQRVAFPLVFQKETTIFANWEPVRSTIEIKFRPLGGVGYQEPIVGKSGDRIESIPNPYRRAGYNFEGWCILYDTDSECYADILLPHTLQYNYTLAPRWVKLNSVDGSIKFEANQGKGETDPLKCSKTQSVYEMVNTFEPPSEDYYFDGYTARKETTSASSSRVILEEEKVKFPYKFDGNVTFVANWAKYSYGTITVHMNDGKTADSKQKYVIGREVESISPVSRENYQFGGWFTSPEFTTQISFPYKVERDIDIYARWVEFKAKGSINFDANGGTGEKSPEYFAYNSTVNFIENPFKHDGFDFLGWYTSPDCKPETKVNFPYQFAGTVTFYASWKFNIPSGMYLISYDMNGGPGTTPTQLTQLNQIARLQIPSQFKTSDGKAFIGWTLYPNTDQPQIYSFLEDFYIQEHFADSNRVIKLYALWSSDYHTITYDFNGGIGESYPTYVDKQKHKNYQYIRIPAFTITPKDGMKLEGWGFTNQYSTYFGNNLLIPSGTITADTTLYAIYYQQNPSQDIPANSNKYKGKRLWLKGMSKIDDSRWEPYEQRYPNLRGIPYDPEIDNWWDAKKLEPYYGGIDSDMCWAGALSNVLHWFFHYNKDYVDKYFQLYPDDPRPNTTFHDVSRSDFFDYFKAHFPNFGFKAKAGMQYFMNGLEGREGGGFFKKVFENTKLTNTTESKLLTRNMFNTFITEALENGLFVTFTITFSENHAVALYGAEYDDDGWIRTLYYVDSNDINIKTLNTKKVVSIVQAHIKYFDQEVYPKFPVDDPESLNNKNPLVWADDNYVPGYYFKIDELQSYSLQSDVWEEFFRNHPVPEN